MYIGTTPPRGGSPGASFLDGTFGTPRGLTTSACSASSDTFMLNGRGTPGSTSRHSRRTEDMEKRLWQAEQKLIDMQGKLTSAHLELKRLRSGAETHAQELSMAKRIQEREQRERAPLLAELTSLREQLRSGGGGGGASVGGGGSGGVGGGGGDGGGKPSVRSPVSAESVLLLRAQLEEAGERSKTFATEADRLRDEVSKLKRALEHKGEAGMLLKELSEVKDERVRLALELHAAKSTASHCRAEAAEARQQMATVAQLREQYAEAARSRDAARAEVERLAGERAASLEEHGQLLQQTRGMADELDSLRSSHAQLAEQKLALVERLNATESSLATLRTELSKREDDFQVDLSIFARRDEAQRAQIGKQSAENAAAAKMIAELTSSLQDARGTSAQLSAEVEALQQQCDESEARCQRLEERLGDATARADASELEARRDSTAHEEHAERSRLKEGMLAQRLEGALRELQGALAERDRLSATLEEALMRCTSSLVAKQLAEDDCKAAQQQLDAHRAQFVS